MLLMPCTFLIWHGKSRRLISHRESEAAGQYHSPSISLRLSLSFSLSHSFILHHQSLFHVSLFPFPFFYHISLSSGLPFFCVCSCIPSQETDTYLLLCVIRTDCHFSPLSFSVSVSQPPPLSLSPCHHFSLSVCLPLYLIPSIIFHYTIGNIIYHFQNESLSSLASCSFIPHTATSVALYNLLGVSV